MEQVNVDRIVNAIIFATQLIIANIWVVGAFLAGPSKSSLMLGIGIGWLIVLIFNKLTRK